jgi:hypothetical protein
MKKIYSFLLNYIENKHFNQEPKKIWKELLLDLNYIAEIKLNTLKIEDWKLDIGIRSIRTK